MIEIKEETIQEIYEKAFEEEYDNILIRDMQIRIESKIDTMTREYLEKLGLTYDYDSERFEGELSTTEYDKENRTDKPLKFKLILVLRPQAVDIKSDNPEFNWN